MLLSGKTKKPKAQSNKKSKEKKKENADAAEL